MKRYKNVTVAGTFDRLHIGQRRLIDEAFQIGENVAVGITTEKLLRNKFLKSQIQNFSLRKSQVEDYLISKKWIDRARFFPLEDIYGIASYDKHLEAVLVTEYSYKNGLAINKLRKKKGLLQLNLINIDLSRGPDGRVISSERIRRGEIDREGNLYSQIFSPGSSLVLPPHLRSKLREPLGEVVGKRDHIELTSRLLAEKLKIIKPLLIIAVGDIVVSSLRKIKKPADIEIVDLHTKREKVRVPKLKHDNIITVNNPASTISYEVIPAYKNSVENSLNINKRTQILINGEEDLVALPAVLMAPLGAMVLYGQFNLGVIAVFVTEDKKEEVRNILKCFK